MRARRRVVAFVLCSAVGLAGCSSATTDETANTTIAESRNASVGCGSDPPGTGRSEVSIRSGGGDRSYIRYVPEGLAPSTPAPLVIDFTAYSPASLEESFSGFTKPDRDGRVKADAVGAVVVTPEPANGNGLLTWNVDHTEGWTDDQQFVTDMIDDVAADTCMHPGRVLAMGFAIGGVMASATACAQPDRITVLATVSGLWDPPDCSASTLVPVVSFHGTDDHFLPFDGGVGDRVSQLGLSAETSIGLVAMLDRTNAVTTSAAWAARNGCDASREEPKAANGVSRVSWTGCQAAVELSVIEDGGHTWPGSNGMAAFESLLGAVSVDLVANDAIWEFFEAHASE